MAETTKIPWCDHTFNPWWGCEKVSAGCDNCYAEAKARRWGFNIWGPEAARRFLSPNAWKEPRKWNAKAEEAGQRRRVFCGSMCDVFEDREQYEAARHHLWEVIADTPWLDWLLLSKRPQNMIMLAPTAWRHGWPENVWALATVESRETRDERIAALLKVPARIRGLSCEPLLGPLDIQWYETTCPHCGKATAGNVTGARGSRQEPFSWYCGRRFCGDQLPLASLDLIIVGCESGRHRRPCSIEDVRAIVEQCRAAGVAVFVKQLEINGRVEIDPRKWPEDLRVQEFPE